MICRGWPCRAGVLLGTVAVGATATSLAGEWTFQPSANLTAAYDSNVQRVGDDSISDEVGRHSTTPTTRTVR